MIAKAIIQTNREVNPIKDRISLGTMELKLNDGTHVKHDFYICNITVNTDMFICKCTGPAIDIFPEMAALKENLDNVVAITEFNISIDDETGKEPLEPVQLLSYELIFFEPEVNRNIIKETHIGFTEKLRKTCKFSVDEDVLFETE